MGGHARPRQALGRAGRGDPLCGGAPHGGHPLRALPRACQRGGDPPHVGRPPGGGDPPMWGQPRGDHFGKPWGEAFLRVHASKIVPK